MRDLPLSQPQLQRLEAAFHTGAAKASVAMKKWLSMPSMIVVESLDQVPLAKTGPLLGDPETRLCVCAMAMEGSLNGQLIFAFEDHCGLSLTDFLLNQPVGTATDWGDVQKSTALESANIIGSAYLNSIAKDLSADVPAIRELVPSPPVFKRDFPESLIESLIGAQAVEANTIFLTRARFEIREQPLIWNLLLFPDVPSLEKLGKVLPDA